MSEKILTSINQGDSKLQKESIVLQMGKTTKMG